MKHLPFTRKSVVDLQLTNLVNHSAGPQERAGELDSQPLFNGIGVQMKSTQEKAAAVTSQ